MNKPSHSSELPERGAGKRRRDEPSRHGAGVARPEAIAGARLACVGGDRANFERLLDRYRDGDPAGFDALYRAIAPRLYCYLLRLSGDRATAGELLRRTFVKLHRARATLLRDTPFIPWMYRVARQLFLDTLRSKRVRAGLPGEFAFPHAAADRASMCEFAQEALDATPLEHREAVYLRLFAELSAQEVALVLGIADTAVEVRVRVSCALISDKLASHHGAGRVCRVHDQVRHQELRGLPEDPQ